MKIRAAAAALAAAFMLSGCSPVSSDVFETPRQPAQFDSLSKAIADVRALGMSLTEPQSGTNRRSVQLVDLDGDGVDEAIAFFRNPKDNYKVSIYLFKETAGGYALEYKGDGVGTSVASVAYADLLGNGDYEIIVGWYNENEENSLTVYSHTGGVLSQIADMPYRQHLTYDLDGDGVNEIVVITHHVGGFSASVYTNGDGRMVRLCEQPLTRGAISIKKLRAGNIAESLCGIAVDIEFGDGTMSTDILSFTDNKLNNITPPDMPRRKFQVLSEDVNSDGVIDIPEPISVSATDSLWSILWKDVSKSTGTLSSVLHTYHAFADNWYVTLPLTWAGNLQAVTHSTRFGESGIDFYVSGEWLFTIYMLTGENRDTLKELKDRFVISERGETVFAAQISATPRASTVITQDYLKNAFHFRQSDWTGE